MLTGPVSFVKYHQNDPLTQCTWMHRCMDGPMYIVHGTCDGQSMHAYPLSQYQKDWFTNCKKAITLSTNP